MSVAKFSRLVGVAVRGPLRLELRAVSTSTTKLTELKPNIPPPEQLFVPLSVPTKLLFGPGPSNPSMRIYNASAMSLLGHLQSDFHHVMDETKAGLKYVFQTNNKYTLAITGAGHAAMEASIMNLVERGERILVCNNGMWGARAQEIAERQGEIKKFFFLNLNHV